MANVALMDYAVGTINTYVLESVSWMNVWHCQTSILTLTFFITTTTTNAACTMIIRVERSFNLVISSKPGANGSPHPGLPSKLDKASKKACGF